MTSNLAAEEIAEHGLQLRADDLDATEGRMKGEDNFLFKTNCSVFLYGCVFCRQGHFIRQISPSQNSSKIK